MVSDDSGADDNGGPAITVHGDETLRVAIDGDGRDAGRLAGRFLDERTYAITELSAGAEAAAILAASLRVGFIHDGVRILASDHPRNLAIHAALAAGGYRVQFSKLLYKRDLAGYRSPHHDPLTYRTLADVGDDVFEHTLIRAHIGDPLEEYSPEEPSMLDAYRALAGDAFEPSRWLLAERDRVPVGVALAQTFPDDPEVGTLYHLGIVPEQRGQGYGLLVHAKGLELLSGVARSYTGSTHASNVGMVAIFERNGCEHAGTQHFYIGCDGSR